MFFCYKVSSFVNDPKSLVKNKFRVLVQSRLTLTDDIKPVVTNRFLSYPVHLPRDVSPENILLLRIKKVWPVSSTL